MTSLILLFLVYAPAYTADEQRAKCELVMETQSTRLTQPPQRSRKELVITIKDGDSGPRHQFDLIGTEFECEVDFAGFDIGTFINCWKPDMSMGIQADRTSLKGKGEHKTPNILSVSGPKGRSKIIFKCDKA